ASVPVTPAAASVQVGQTMQLAATPKDANGNPLSGRIISWSSSNTSVVGVNSSGLVTAVATGGATITATSEGQSGTASITVPPVPVATVAVAPASASVNEGQTVQLVATLKDASGNTLTGRTVTWASSNTAAATVSSSGLVTGKVAGAATITATSETVSGTSAITVVHVPVASVAVTPASASVPAGQTVQLTATLKDANGNTLTGRTVTWASSNTAAATVTGSGPDPDQQRWFVDDRECAQRRPQPGGGGQDVEVVCGEHSERVLSGWGYGRLCPETQCLRAAVGRSERPERAGL